MLANFSRTFPGPAHAPQSGAGAGGGQAAREQALGGGNAREFFADVFPSGACSPERHCVFRNTRSEGETLANFSQTFSFSGRTPRAGAEASGRRCSEGEIIANFSREFPCVGSPDYRDFYERFLAGEISAFAASDDDDDDVCCVPVRASAIAMALAEKKKEEKEEEKEKKEEAEGGATDDDDGGGGSGGEEDGDSGKEEKDEEEEEEEEEEEDAASSSVVLLFNEFQIQISLKSSLDVLSSFSIHF